MGRGFTNSNSEQQGWPAGALGSRWGGLCCCLGLTKASERQLQTPDLSAQFGFHEWRWGWGWGARARMRGSDDSKATCNYSSPVKGLVANVGIWAVHPLP